MVNVLPSPSWLSTSMVPPLASTRFLDRARPRPMPRPLVVKRGSNIFFMFSTGMPRPVSVMERETAPSAAFSSLAGREVAPPDPPPILGEGDCSGGEGQ